MIPMRKDRKSTRLNSSHSQISYAVFCLKKKNTNAKHIVSAAVPLLIVLSFFFFNDPATTEIYPLSLPDALPISQRPALERVGRRCPIVSAQDFHPVSHHATIPSCLHL